MPINEWTSQSGLLASAYYNRRPGDAIDICNTILYTFAGGISFTYATTAVAVAVAIVVVIFYDDNFDQIIFVVVDDVYVFRMALKFIQNTSNTRQHNK